jgi:hypothetical protein
MMARNDRDMPLAPSAAIVDEQTKRAAMRTPTPVRSTSPASVRRFDETGKGFAKPETKNTTVSTTSPASTRRFEETGAGFPKPVVQNVTGWVKAKTIQTASGPIDVDANGLAADGSTPTAITQTDEKNTITSEKSDAYKKLFDEFNALGLGALVEDGKDLLMKATSVSAMPEALRGTKAYMTRFSANDARIKAGFKALSPAAYLALEDQYQNVMREYGLPASYYTPGLYGKQEGFEKLIASDISNTELEDRLMVAQDRVLKSNPEVLKALKDFYPDIKDGDILAYTLDPENAIKNIQRKVTAAEIGGAAMQAGLTTNLARAEELQKYGVNKAAATEGFQAVAEVAPRGGQLAAIYGESPYTQQTAEQEIFNLTGSREARRQRQKVTGLEKATFGGQSGVTSGALARDRAGGI